MGGLWGLILLSGFYPLWRAWQAAAGSTLRHPLAWAGCAWAAWCLAGGFDVAGLHYLALCLTACAGVAVLNARRPYERAWHFVVAGLLVLLLRPLWERPGEWHLDGLYLAVLAVGLLVALGNYLPTRLGPAALLLGGWCGLDLARMTGTLPSEGSFTWLILAAVPWLGLLLARRWERYTAFDAEWRTFRDRFGFVWAQRLREQFNRAAVHAGWDLRLGWTGLHGPGDAEQALGVLRSALRRFETVESP